MAANNNPIFTALPDVQWAASAVLAANTTTNLTTGTSYLVFTADATNGGFVQKLIARALGTNVATVLRLWINNGLTTGTAANNILIGEMTLPATAVSQVAALAAYEMQLGFALPPGYMLYVTLGTAVAAGFGVTVLGGKY